MSAEVEEVGRRTRSSSGTRVVGEEDDKEQQREVDRKKEDDKEQQREVDRKKEDDKKQQREVDRKKEDDKEQQREVYRKKEGDKGQQAPILFVFHPKQAFQTAHLLHACSFYTTHVTLTGVCHRHTST
eukprot:355127-Chlamydomonas_euryale.AAC.21